MPQSIEQIICPKCGSNNNSWMKQCLHCGTALTELEPIKSDATIPITGRSRWLFIGGIILAVALLIVVFSPSCWKWQEEGRLRNLDKVMTAQGCLVIPAFDVPIPVNQQLNQTFLRSIVVKEAAPGKPGNYAVTLTVENRTYAPVWVTYSFQMWDKVPRDIHASGPLQIFPQQIAPRSSAEIVELVDVFPMVPPRYAIIKEKPSPIQIPQDQGLPAIQP